MSDPRKTETLDLRVRFRFSRLIDPELFLVLSNLTEAERSSLLHAMPEELDMFALADLYQGHTIADIESAMPYALNCAAEDDPGHGRPEIRPTHLGTASSCRAIGFSKNLDKPLGSSVSEPSVGQHSDVALWRQCER